MNILVNPLAIPAAPTKFSDSERDARYEIVDGQRVETPPMSTTAVMLVNELYALLYPQVRDRGHFAMEMPFRLPLTRERVRIPDLAFVSFERWPKTRPYGDEDGWEVAPNVAIEVISPSERVELLMEKLEEYFAAGVQLVWVVHTKQRLIHVFESLTRVRGFGPGDTLAGGAVLPDFRLPVDTVFPADKAE